MIDTVYAKLQQQGLNTGELSRDMGAEPDPYRASVKKEQSVPEGAATLIAQLGHQYYSVLMTVQREAEQQPTGQPPRRPTPPVNGISWQDRAGGLRFVLKSIGQLPVANVAEMEASKTLKPTRPVPGK